MKNILGEKNLSPAGLWLFCLPALMLLAFVAFGAVIPGEFVVDDRLWGHAHGDARQSQALLASMGAWVFRPLHGTFMQVMMMVAGPNPAAWHVLSILLHSANGLLFFLLLQRLLPNADWRWLLACSAIFLLHPAGSEAVLWISALAEVTVTMAMLICLLYYLRWRERWTPLRLLLFGGMIFTACLFKETAIMLAPVFLVMSLVDFSRKKAGHRWAPVLVAGGATLTFLLVRQGVLGSASGGLPLNFDPERIAELLLAHLRFLWLPAAPPFALRPPELSLASGIEATLAGTILLTTLLLAFWYRVAKGTLALAVSWGVFGLWTAVAVAMVGEGFFNGRQAYVASLGMALLVAASFAEGGRRFRWPAGVGLALLLGWMLYASMGAAVAWRSNADIYRQSIAVSPNAHEPRAGLAVALAERGDIDAALAMYRSALERASTDPQRINYLFNMASLLGQAGRGDESDAFLDELLRLDTDNSFAWTGKGNNAWAAGRLADAADHYRRALQLAPGNREAATNLAALQRSLRREN